MATVPLSNGCTARCAIPRGTDKRRVELTSGKESASAAKIFVRVKTTAGLVARLATPTQPIFGVGRRAGPIRDVESDGLTAAYRVDVAAAASYTIFPPTIVKTGLMSPI